MKVCLIVDDSRTVRMVANKIVTELGLEPKEAADGKEALDFCHSSMPDGILLDWNMPVMDGLEFLIELRKTPGGERPAIVFCTTENDIDHIQRAIEAGANEYIMKPFNAEIVEEKFRQVGIL